jgi:hypothetical protein
MTVLYDAEAERDIYLIFQADQSYLCSALFKKGFKHCFALERQALGWICVDPSRKNFIATILPAGFHADIITPFLDQNPTSTVIRLTVAHNEKEVNTYPRLGLISCVSVMQYLLGVYWPLIITPYQLYCRLVKAHVPGIRLKQQWQAVKERDEPQMRQRKPHESRQTY